jgi:hypothetical protein
MAPTLPARPSKGDQRLTKQSCLHQGERILSFFPQLNSRKEMSSFCIRTEKTMQTLLESVNSNAELTPECASFFDLAPYSTFPNRRNVIGVRCGRSEVP